MKQCTDVFDIVPPNQRAVIVFSRGSKFEFDSKGSGETGNWIVDTERLKQMEKVVIYLRKPNDSSGRISLEISPVLYLPNRPAGISSFF